MGGLFSVKTDERKRTATKAPKISTGSGIKRNTNTAHQVEFAPLVIGIGIQPVVIVEFLVAGRDIAVLGDEIIAFDQRLGHDVARRHLEGGLAVIGIALAMFDHDAPVEHQDAQALFGQFLGGETAADARPDHDRVETVRRRHGCPPL